MKSQKGFSLLEVMIAMMLSTGAIMLSMRTVDFIKSAQSRADNYTKAHNIAVSQLEQLMATFPTDSKLTAGTHTQAFDLNGNPVAAGGNFTATWVVNADTPITKIMKINISVVWQERGSQHTVQILTFRES